MFEPISLPFYVIVALFTMLGISMFISTWNYYGRREAVKQLARTLKTDTEVIADKLAIESEHLAGKVETNMQEFVRNEVKITYKDIAHDIALLTLAVKDVAKGSIIDASKKDVIIMKLESEMRLLNERNWNLKEDAKEDAVKINGLKEEAKVDARNIERLESEKT